MSALDNGRYSVAAGCVGICDGCVDASVAYAKERKQFGVPLARFQLVQEMIADMILKRDASRMLVYRAGVLKDEGKPNTTGDLGREALRDRVRGRMRQPGDPGPRRLRLRRRLPGRALPARRPRHHPLRGHLADPEADHRPRRDRESTRCSPSRRAESVAEMVETTVDDFGVGLLRLNRPETRNALSAEMRERLARRAGAPRRRPGGALHRHRRLRQGLRRRRRHPGDGGARPDRGPPTPAALPSGSGWPRSRRR